MAPGHVVFGGLDGDDRVPARLEGGTEDEGTVAAQRGIDEKLGKALGLGLRADKKPDPKDHTAQAEEQGTLPVSEEPDGDVKRRTHGTLASPLTSTSRDRAG